MDAFSMNWRATAQKLKEALHHHIEEEEGKIFSTAKQVLSVEEAEMMAQAFEKLKPEVREQSSFKSALDLVANLMPARFTSIVRSYNHRVN
jgi:hemerythrin-like domain-containing protein